MKPSNFFFAILLFLVACGDDEVKKPKGDSSLNPSTKEVSQILKVK